MELKIIIEDKDETTLLEEIALENDLSMVQYATNIVRGWIKGQLRGRYLKHLQDREPEELRTILGDNYRFFGARIAEMKAKKEIK